MKKSRLIFYIVFGVFQLATFIFTLVMDAFREDFSFLMQLFKYINLFKYFALVGIVLMGLDIAWAIVAYRNNQKEKNALINELTALKAKLFDMQEAAKSPISQAVDKGK